MYVSVMLGSNLYLGRGSTWVSVILVTDARKYSSCEMLDLLLMGDEEKMEKCFMVGVGDDLSRAVCGY